MIWVGGKPALQLRLNLVHVRAIAREQKRLREYHQVLVPVQFPNRLVVASPYRVQVWNQPKIVETCFDPAGVIPPPADLGSGFDRQAKNWKPMCADLLSERDHIPSEACTGKSAG